MVGKKFGRLKAVKFAGSIWKNPPSSGRRQFLECICDCGSSHLADSVHLNHGGTTSCGCFRSDEIRKRLTKHGYAPLKGKRKSIYHIWKGMISRCENPNNSHFKYYGGRGISVCKRWTGDRGFQMFLSDMGEPQPGMSIERKDVNLGYSPENCCWIPFVEQSKNRNHNWKVSMNGEVMTAREASRRLGIKRGRIDWNMKKMGLEKSNIHDINAILNHMKLR